MRRGGLCCAPLRAGSEGRELTPLLAQVCLLGRSRTYPPAAEALADQRRTQYISSRRAPGPAPAPLGAETGSVHCCHRGLPDCPSDGLPDDPPNGPGALEPGAEGRWLPGFHPRDRAERVRNCTALPREFVDQVVLQVASLLLGGAQLSPGSPPSGSPPSGSTRTWNPGGNRHGPAAPAPCAWPVHWSVSVRDSDAGRRLHAQAWFPEVPLAGGGAAGQSGLWPHQPPRTPSAGLSQRTWLTGCRRGGL